MNSRRHNAFTLPEVIVAIVILALAVTVLGQTVTNSVRAIQYTEERDYFSWPMRKMREQILALPTREEVEAGGEMEINTIYDFGDRQTEREWKLSWEAEIKSTPILHVHQVEVEVTLQAGDHVSEIREIRLIAFRPNWDDPDEIRRIEEAAEERARSRLQRRGQEDSEAGP